MKQTTITNDNGDIVTRINVTRTFTYDIEEMVQQLREDNRVGHDDDLVITLDDILERVLTLAEDDFGAYSSDLILQDENGNDY
jgi:hypothetical protein